LLEALFALTLSQKNGNSLAQELGGGRLPAGMNPQIVIVVYASIYRRGISRRNCGKKLARCFSRQRAGIARGSYTVTCLVKWSPAASFAQICQDLRKFTYGQEQCWSDLNIAQDKFSHSRQSRGTKLIYIHTNPSVNRETGVSQAAQLNVERLRKYVEGELNLRYGCAMSVNEVTKNHTERFALLFIHDTHVKENMIAAAFGPFLSPAEQEEEKKGTTRSFINMLNESKTFVNFNSFRQVKTVMAACKRNELSVGDAPIFLHNISLVQNSERMQNFEIFLEEEGYLSVKNALPLSVIEGFVTRIFDTKKTNETQRLNMIVMLRSYLSDELGYPFDSEKDVYYTGCAATILPVKEGVGCLFNGNADCAADFCVPDQCNEDSHSAKPQSASLHVPWYGRECPIMHTQLLKLPTPMRMKMLKMWCAYNQNCNNPF